MNDANISLDSAKMEFTIVSGNVELRYMRKEPENGCILIARENMPSLRIPMSEWDAIETVLSNKRSVASWLNASVELGK